MTIPIHYVVYHGSKTPENREIGLAVYKVRMEGSITQVSITQEYKGGKLDGKKIYPTLYVMPTSEVVKYPVKPVGKTTKVDCYMIPLRDFQHQKFDLKEAQYYEAIKQSEKPKKVETKPEIIQATLF
jgi:hypothetical protein